MAVRPDLSHCRGFGFESGAVSEPIRNITTWMYSVQPNEIFAAASWQGRMIQTCSHALMTEICKGRESQDIP